jgi:hypothetical protein
VLLQKNSQLLLEEIELDRLAIHEWAIEVVAPVVTDPIIIDDDLGAGVSLLGEKQEGVPDKFHDEMEEAAQKGDMPRTTLARRIQNRGTAGSEYGVPACLSDALKFGYISPNFPPPRGFAWVGKSGKWKLVIKGG